jgi:hypothetical protein
MKIYFCVLEADPSKNKGHDEGSFLIDGSIKVFPHSRWDIKAKGNYTHPLTPFIRPLFIKDSL